MTRDKFFTQNTRKNKIALLSALLLIAAALLTFATAHASAAAREPLFQDGSYQIGTAEELVWFGRLVNNEDPSASAVLTANIDLSAVDWIPIGTNPVFEDEGHSFAGTFDGQGHAISGLRLKAENAAVIYSYRTGEADGLGLFGAIGTTGAVRNLKLERTEAEIVDWQEPLVLAPLAASNQGVIENVAAEGTRFALESMQGSDAVTVGGIVGINVKNAWLANAAVRDSELALRSGAYMSGEMGGVVGVNAGSIRYARTFGGALTVEASSGNVTTGGIVGLVEMHDLTGRNNELIGSTVNGTKIHARYTDSRSWTDAAIGGLVGTIRGYSFTMKGNTAKNIDLRLDGDSNSRSMVGGLVGLMEIYAANGSDHFTNNILTGDETTITAMASGGELFVGGLAGHAGYQVDFKNSVVAGGQMYTENRDGNVHAGALVGGVAYATAIRNVYYREDFFPGGPLVGYKDDENMPVEAYAFGAKTPGDKLPALAFELDKTLVDLDGTDRVTLRAFPGTQGIVSVFWYLEDPTAAAVRADGESAVLTGKTPGASTRLYGLVLYRDEASAGQTANIQLSGFVNVLAKGDEGDGGGTCPPSVGSSGSSGCSALPLAGLSLLLLPLFLKRKIG